MNLIYLGRHYSLTTKYRGFEEVNKMLILGVNTAYHETAVALLEDGNLLSAVEEERFSGIRHGKQASPFGSWQLPFQAINYCLAEAGITLRDLDYIIFSFNPRELIPSMLLSLLQGKWQQFTRQFGYWYFNKSLGRSLVEEVPHCQEISKRFIGVKNLNEKIRFVDHHLAHAASTFFCSPFEEAGILSVDGIGERTCTFLGVGKKNKIISDRRFSYPHSLGFFYEEVTKFLGFQRNHDEYKVMALASQGKSKYYKQLRQLVPPEITGGPSWHYGGYKVKIDFRQSGIFGVREIIAALPIAPRMWGAKIEQEHADVAASAQKILEERLVGLTKWLCRLLESKSGNLCIAGGVGLNCVANEFLRINSEFDNIFVQPAANDAGTALGAALWLQHQILKQSRSFVMNHVYLGPKFSNKEIQEKLKENKVHYQFEKNVAQTAATLIAKGNIVGWFQGRMEWGPRALGNRSILADPRNPKIKEIINQIKGREDFRPVCPTILEEKAGEWFESSEPSPFMLFARKVRPDKAGSIPAVVHVDGTARLQTVSQKQNPLFYQLIKEFEKITGIPLVVNTSLNYQGKPIVATIEQALDCFINSGLDYLVIGKFIVHKGDRGD